MDLLVLHALKNKARYRMLRPVVKAEMVGGTTMNLLDWFGLYWQAYPEHDNIDADALNSLIRLRAGEASAEALALMQHQVNRLNEYQDSASVNGVLKLLYENEFAGTVAAKISQYQAGAEIDITYELNRLASENSRRVAQSSVEMWADADMTKILAELSSDRGFKLPTHALRTHVAGLLGGDSVAIASRPDKGKTSLIASILTHFSCQREGIGYGGRPMIWLNNEGTYKRIVPRVYQAALNATFEQIVQWSNEGTLVQKYTDAMGAADAVRWKDMHGATLAQVEQLVEEANPCVVVFDMLANFRMPNVGGGNKTDALEQMWQEVREMAVRHDFIALSTIQISAEGGNQLYPPYSALKDSKTGVQGATDVILMMGSLEDPMMAAQRGFSTPKNKRQMPGKPSNVQAMVEFDAPKCQFNDGDA